MGLLKQIVPNNFTIVRVDETAPVSAPMIEEVLTPVLAPAPAQKSTELDIKRDPHGFIESATGYNAAGEKVRFEFERDGRKRLERIKVK